MNDVDQILALIEREVEHFVVVYSDGAYTIHTDLGTVTDCTFTSACEELFRRIVQRSMQT